MQGFIAHRGTQKVTRNRLYDLPAPASMGRLHRPIPHAELVATLTGVLSNHGIGVLAEEFSIGKNSLFGFMKTDKDQNDIAFAIGLRSDNAQRFGVQVVGGFNVFVCDNMAFIGEWHICDKKHTTGLNLRDALDGGVLASLKAFGTARQTIQRMREHVLPEEASKAIVFDLANSRALPLRFLRSVYDEYVHPRHREFEGQTEWSLFNAVTEVAKQLPLNPRMRLLTDLGTHFDM